MSPLDHDIAGKPSPAREARERQERRPDGSQQRSRAEKEPAQFAKHEPYYIHPVKSSAAAHVRKLQNLLEVEREAEKAENLRAIRRFPLSVREAQGKTATGLALARVGVGFSGSAMLDLSKPATTGDLSAFHAMGAGDNVLVTFPAGFDPRAYEGTLYRVEAESVTVALKGPGPAGLSPRGARGAFEIDLLGSEATYQRSRSALERLANARKNRLSELRGISLGEAKASRKPFKIARFFNRGLNSFQQEAVKKALEAKDFALIHGPPGTGKTTVLVEVIRQEALRGGRIMASAPSNIAVDNILEKLGDSDLRIVRLGHPARTLESLRHFNLSYQVEEDPEFEEVRRIERLRESLISGGSRLGRGQLGYDERIGREREIKKLWREARSIENHIAKSILSRAQVVLATHAGIPERMVEGGFDLVCLDEASQATEPLSWIPLQWAGKAVLAGDAKQLPPTLYSSQAAKDGLAVTLFDRLIEILPESFQMLLRVQYRMHQAIMEFSSREFYEGKLVADESVKAHTANQLPGVATDPVTSVPVVFVDTAGAGYGESWNEMLESRENEGEARLIRRLVEAVIGAGVQSRDVAVITPYIAQARLLKSLLKVHGLEVGSIDGFQGREKEVSILSLVRSNDKGEIGFLGELRRMNVAITRARRLLIVVADSATIGRHPFFERFIDYMDALDAHRSSFEWPE